jgi:hypothetical protein
MLTCGGFGSGGCAPASTASAKALQSRALKSRRGKYFGRGLLEVVRRMAEIALADEKSAALLSIEFDTCKMGLRFPSQQTRMTGLNAPVPRFS